MKAVRGLFGGWVNVISYFVFILTCVASFDLSLDSVGVTFLLLSIQTAIFVSVYSTGVVSLRLVYFLFVLIFLNIIPWLHYTKNISIWRPVGLNYQTYISTNFSIFFSSLIVFVSGFIWKSDVALKKNYFPLMGKDKSRSIPPVLIVFSVTGFLLTFALNDFSIANLMFRGLVDEIRGGAIEISSLQLLIGQCARFLPFFVFVYAATKISGRWGLKIFLFFLLLMTVFPTGVPRYMVSFVYLPIALIYFKDLRRARVFSVTLILSTVFIFPFLDQFRSFSGFDELKLLPSVDYFYAAHFDAYENMASAIESGFVTYGWQLLGVLFFYVPRIFWENKPIGSGSQMANDLGYVFDNISMPYLGEGYVNFGYLGIALFAILLSFFMLEVDKRYRGYISVKGRVGFDGGFYFYLASGLFFIMRGDMLSSVAYLSAGVFVYIFICKVVGYYSSRSRGGM